MWRKVLLCVLFLSLLAGNVAAQGQSYHAQRFDVDVVVREDGSLAVTETVVFEFAGDPFTFVFRELETDRTDGMRNIRAAVDRSSVVEAVEAIHGTVERGDERGRYL